ncbi:MAG: threonine synthase [Desulfuromonadaceae bacterium]|nr:threonine synthase [Desulfuromonadaceae bacterium]
MRYKSTRGSVSGISFSDAVMMGLATDGGLLLPEQIPTISTQERAQFHSMEYPELAFNIIKHFVGDDIPADELQHIIERSYNKFTHPQVTPVERHGEVHILELFHGPTLAFKDVALQFLGNLFEYLLKQRGSHMNIIGATSGDTGSAAIYGVKGKKNINIFILHPEGRVSPIQELQMTTVTDPNVFNLAIDGNFDDGQRIVKEIFGDLEFKHKHALGAVNSINWARVLAQIVYYFYAWSRTAANVDARVDFAVPTGNFGDIFAGYMAKQMGLPIGQLVLATNENNILSRFVAHGDYSIDTVVETLSPSMDIQVASNFERYLYYLLDGDSNTLVQMMEDFSSKHKMAFSATQQQQVQDDFSTLTVDTEATLKTIARFYTDNKYILDPHTAVGVTAGEHQRNDDVPMICLATAHPAKFSAAVRRAIDIEPPRPESLRDIEQRAKRCEPIQADTQVIKDYIATHALS